jgi:hypothetical protein
MNALINQISTLPAALIYGAIGFLGGVVAWVLARAAKSTSSMTAWIVFGILFAMSLARFLAPNPAAEARSILAEVTKTRLFSSLFLAHPEAREQLQEKLETVVATTTSDERNAKAQLASGEIVGKYLNQHYLVASNDKLQALFVRNAETIKSYQNEPVRCVAYYLGRLQYSKEERESLSYQQELEMKADIISNNPMNLLPPYEGGGSIEDVRQKLDGAYKAKGYDPEDMQFLDKIDTVPPEQGCKAAVEYIDTLASMDAATAGYVFKSLLSLPQ